METFPTTATPAAEPSPATSPTGVTVGTLPEVESRLEDEAPPPPEPVINFSGRLLERGTRRPIPDAQVVLPDIGMMTFTDDEGAFAFEDVPSGEHQIIAPVVGYQRLLTQEQFTETERVEAIYYLEPLFSSPLEIVVEADRVRKEVSRTTLDAQEIRKVPGTSNDPVRVVTVLPGVATSNELGTDLLIRGSGPFDNRIEVDRIPVPYVYHFGGIRSVLNANLIEQIDFQAGGFSPQFGQATGGVLHARTREGRRDRMGGAIDVNLILSEAFVEGPVGDRGSFFVAGRRSYFDLILGPVAESLLSPEDVQFSVFPQFSDYQLRFDYRLTTHTTVHAFLFGANDVLGLATERTNPRDPDLTGEFYIHPFFHIQSIGATTRLGNIQNQVNLYHSYEGQNLEIGDAASFLNIRNNAVGLNNDLSLRLAPEHTLHTGVQLRYSRIRLDSRFPQPPRPGQSDFTFTDAEFIDADKVIPAGSIGAYVEHEAEWAPGWLLVPGLRFDYYSQDEDYAYVDPRLTTRWQWTEDTALKAAVGRYSDFASEQQLDSDYGNPDLDPIHSYHYVAGVEQRVGPRDTLDVQTYYKQLSQLPSRDPRDGSLGNEGRGYAYGVELFWRRHMTERFFGWASYAYARSFRQYPGDEDWVPAGFDQPHIMNLVASYKLTRNWETGLRWRYNSGSPDTPIEDRIYLADVGFYIPIPGDRNSERLPSQHRLDARVEYTHAFPTWILRAYLEVLNVYGAENAADYIHNYDFTSRRPLNMLPIPIPALGVRAEF